MTEKTSNELQTILYKGEEIHTAKLSIFTKQAIARQNELQNEANRLELLLSEQMLVIKNYAAKIQEDLEKVLQEMGVEESSEKESGKPWEKKAQDSGAH